MGFNKVQVMKMHPIKIPNLLRATRLGLCLLHVSQTQHETIDEPDERALGLLTCCCTSFGQYFGAQTTTRLTGDFVPTCSRVS